LGALDPPSDANPTLARSNTLKFWKKALPLFMPDCLMEWSRTQEEGNPTRSIEINELIKQVKKKEVRKQGAASKTRQPMKETEFQQHVLVTGNQGSMFLDEILESGDQGNDFQENRVGNNRQIQQGILMTEQ
jgi:hypothetical protein